MLPNCQDNFEIATLPTRTFRLGDTAVTGYAEGLRAVEQAVRLILSTERYEWLIFSWDYGVELGDLIGKDTEYCIPEIERRVREALLQDDRILGVSDFSFTTNRGKIHCECTVTCKYGDFSTSLEVTV